VELGVGEGGGGGVGVGVRGGGEDHRQDVIHINEAHLQKDSRQ
jgi:hypothetical protein